MVSNKVVTLIIALFLLFALYMIFPKISAAVQAFTSIGEDEPAALTKLKKDCEKYQEDNYGEANGCLLDVAIATLEAGENPMIAESFLRSQINAPDADEKILRQCLEFAKNELYPKSQDWLGAIYTYEELYKKMHTEEVRMVLVDAHIKFNEGIIFGVYNALIPGAYINNAALLRTNAQLLQTSLKNLVKIYVDNKGAIPDKKILDNCDIVYDSTSRDDRSKISDACSLYSRESYAYGCYLESPGNCISCAQHPNTRYVGAGASNYEETAISRTEYVDSASGEQVPSDLCRGYPNKASCDADPCNMGDCKWVYMDCINVPGTINTWDMP